MIDKYYEINKSFMLNFGEKKKGLFMSSGFDSSYLLALQEKLLGSSNIVGLTCVQKFNERSGVYNKFEIERVKKLAKFYNIKNYFIDVNLKDNFQKLSEETGPICGNTMNTNHLSSMMFYKVAQLGKSKLGTKTLMSGEISDGAHNLGFSQFLTSFDHENQVIENILINNLITFSVLIFWKKSLKIIQLMILYLTNYQNQKE